jgi:hypothetical protein
MLNCESVEVLAVSEREGIYYKYEKSSYIYSDLCVAYEKYLEDDDTMIGLQDINIVHVFLCFGE